MNFPYALLLKGHMLMLVIGIQALVASVSRQRLWQGKDREEVEEDRRREEEGGREWAGVCSR